MQKSRFDVIVFGATSFVGQILAHYLAEEFGTQGRLRWAIAGRSAARLESLREALGPRGARLETVVADAADEDALREMCGRTSVVVSTVGPYSLYGEPLVKVCTATGTDYCDLTGEPQWMWRMLHRYEAAARKSGARIVHACGFDSIPSDLGVHFLQGEALRRFGAPCTRVKTRIKAIRGSFSGGTYASALATFEQVARDPQLRKVLGDPYSLCPPGESKGPRQPEVRFAEFDADFGSWTAPFVMSAVNTRVVLRSNALSGHAYGRDFRYDEAMLTTRGLKGRLAAAGVACALAGFAVAGAVGPLRGGLQRFVLPKPGQGPSPEQQKKGFFDFRIHGRTADGRCLVAKVTGDRDPGYGSTAKMLGQAAACLATDVAKGRPQGGFWTPATIFGDTLVERLRAHSGLTFEILPG
jgi:short subunit dehydrogenase-like uncharacterized protein